MVGGGYLLGGRQSVSVGQKVSVDRHLRYQKTKRKSNDRSNVRKNEETGCSTNALDGTRNSRGKQFEPLDRSVTDR